MEGPLTGNPNEIQPEGIQMSTEHHDDRQSPDTEEAVDVSGRPLAELPDYQLLEDARSTTTHAFTLVNGLLHSKISDERRETLERELRAHMDVRKKIPFVGRNGWIDILTRYPKICAELEREWESRESLDD